MGILWIYKAFRLGSHTTVELTDVDACKVVLYIRGRFCWKELRGGGGGSCKGKKPGTSNSVKQISSAVCLSFVLPWGCKAAFMMKPLLLDYADLRGSKYSLFGD